MNSPDKTATLPLQYATELAFEMQLMRAECCEAANALMQERELDEAGLEECATLEEALGKAQRLLQSAVGLIRKPGAGRTPPRQ